MNISEWKQALRDHSQLWCHNCPNPKGQSWPKGSAHNFEWKGDVSGKSILETHHLCGLCLEVRTTWKQPELRRSPAWVLHQSAPKVARGFGSGKHSHLTPTWLPERGLIFSPNSPYLLLQTSCSFFSTTITCCLLQGMLKLYVFLLYSSFVFPSFICSFLYPFILIVGPLKNEACSLNFWNKEFLSWGWRLWATTEDNGTSCQKNVSCFFICPGKVLLLDEAEEPLSPQCTASLSRPAARCTQHVLLAQAPPSQQWAPQLHRPWGLAKANWPVRWYKEWSTNQWAQYWGRSRVRRTRAAVVITRGRQGSLDWCSDPEKQATMCSRHVWCDYKFTHFCASFKCSPRLKKNKIRKDKKRHRLWFVNTGTEPVSYLLVTSWRYCMESEVRILTVTFWAALSPWIERNGLVPAAFSGEACVPESKLFMGICAPPVICNCCTSDWWCWWWWCCCCTNWYKRAWCCSLSNMGRGRRKKKKSTISCWKRAPPWVPAYPDLQSEQPLN